MATVSIDHSRDAVEEWHQSRRRHVCSISCLSCLLDRRSKGSAFIQAEAIERCSQIGIVLRTLCAVVLSGTIRSYHGCNHIPDHRLSDRRETFSMGPLRWLKNLFVKLSESMNR